MKICSNPNCVQQNPQPLENFGLNKGPNSSSRRANCKICECLAQKKRMENPANKIKKKIYESSQKAINIKKNYHLMIRYGITLEQYENLFKNQNGRCAIKNCSAELALRGRSTHVDHCHNTGKIRGLLCRACNHALGHIKDNPLIALGLNEYLIKNNQN